ncbi:GNAT family N-acetyltransferase [Aurantiacibacter odishensis]|uniref:GNAT family N-acetyltransferase n=1 Tax=Aurantiacibacter odishensis TaxID=1155476 RepID=UPI000E712A1E|nr:GNAT family N-acetyltransferase [Aurantiacibacter odishensis]
MTALTYRDATPDDLPFIAALGDADEVAAARDPARATIAEEQRKALAAITTDPNHRLLVVERDGERVGSFQLSFIPGVSRQGAWRGQIESVRVIDSLRGQGIGEAMMRWAIDRCAEKGCGVVQLTSDRQRDAAHRFYERLGFEPTHTGFKMKLL